MKKFKPLIISLSIIQLGYAQTTLPTVQKGDIILTGSYGVPNFLTTALKDAYELPTHENLDVTSSGSIALRGSYSISNILSVGLEVDHSSSCIQWQVNSTHIPDDSINTPSSHTFSLQASRLRILGILNYHFYIRERYNLYFGFGLGYNHLNINFGMNRPGDHEMASPCLLPVSARTKVGFNYYLNKAIAINSEIGIGGPLASIGITGRF